MADVVINKNGLSLKVLTESDTLGDVVSKTQYNFDAILLNGGGPKGKTGDKGERGYPGATGKGVKGDAGIRGSKIYFESTAIVDNTLVVNPLYKLGDVVIDSQGSYFELEYNTSNQLVYKLKFNINTSSIIDFLVSKFQYDAVSGNPINKWSYKEQGSIFDSKGTLLLANKSIMSSNDQSEFYRLVIGDDRLPVPQNATLSLVNILPNSVTTTNYDDQPFSQLVIKYRKFSNVLAASATTYHIYREDSVSNPFYEIKNISTSVVLKHNITNDDLSEVIVRGRIFRLVGNKSTYDDFADVLTFNVGATEALITSTHDMKFVVAGGTVGGILSIEAINTNILTNIISYTKKSGITPIIENFTGPVTRTVNGNYIESITISKTERVNTIISDGNGNNVNLSLINGIKIIDSRLYKRTAQEQLNYVTLDMNNPAIYNAGTKTLTIPSTSNDFVLVNPNNRIVAKIVCTNISDGTTINLRIVFNPGVATFTIEKSLLSSVDVINHNRTKDIVFDFSLTGAQAGYITLLRANSRWDVKDYSRSAKLDQDNILTGVNDFRGAIVENEVQITATVTPSTNPNIFNYVTNISNRLISALTSSKPVGFLNKGPYKEGSIITITNTNAAPLALCTGNAASNTAAGINFNVDSHGTTTSVTYGTLLTLPQYTTAFFKLTRVSGSTDTGLSWYCVGVDTKAIAYQTFAEIGYPTIVNEPASANAVASAKLVGELANYLEYGWDHAKAYKILNGAVPNYHNSNHSDADYAGGGTSATSAFFSLWQDNSIAWSNRLLVDFPTFNGNAGVEMLNFQTRDRLTRFYTLYFKIGLVHTTPQSNGPNGSTGSTFTTPIECQFRVFAGFHPFYSGGLLYETPFPALRVWGGRAGESTLIINEVDLGYIAPGTNVVVNMRNLNAIAGGTYAITHFEWRLIGKATNPYI